MKKYLALLIMLIVYIDITVAQTNTSNLFTISGQIVDSLSNEGVPYATVGIALAQTPKQFIKGVACDGNGKFELQIKDAGSYVMAIQSIGKKAIIKPLELSDAKKNIDIGKIPMSDDAQQISEVSIVAQKPLVKVEIDKLIYDIEEDPESKVNNTLEMLRKVPLVTVDGEDKIQLKGSTNFKIYLNGKPSNLFSGQNVSDVLKSMPASSVKNIEVITDPGARYDAEGIGGIINIVTARNLVQGYSGSVSANAGTFGSYGGGGYITAKAGKFGLTSNLNYSNYKRPWGNTEITNENFINDQYYREINDGKAKSRGTYISGYLEASYEIDTLNLLSLGVNLYDGKETNNAENDIIMFNRSDAIMYTYNRSGEGKNNYGRLGINFDYQRSTRKKGELLTFSYRFYNSPDGSQNYMYINDITGTPPSHLANQWHDNDAKTREHTGQIDYVNPITPVHSIEAGFKYIFRQNLSHIKQYEMPQNASEWTLLPSNSHNDFNHSSYIYAGYMGYSLKIKKIGLKTGIRAEATKQDVIYKLNETMNFNTDYFNIVPSITASYQLKANQQIRLGYNLRIFRPSIWYLNPYVNDTDPFNISYGNPNLDAEKGHNINLNYSFFTRKLTLNLNTTYTYINNAITNYTFIDPMNPNVKQQTYDNIGKRERAVLYANASWTPTTKLRITINGGMFYDDLKSQELGASNSGLNGEGFANIQLTLPYDFRINMMGAYITGFVMLQGKQSSQYRTNVSISKDFLKQKLTVSLTCSNPTSNSIKINYSRSDEYFAMNNKNNIKIREARLNISYRFGTMKESIKKVQRSITNDDVKSGGSSESGGGGL